VDKFVPFQARPQQRLEEIDPAAVAEPMAELYESVARCLRRAGAQRSNAWVTASKICARKRPNLFPVRDNVVLDLLAYRRHNPSTDQPSKCSCPTPA
jgi:hypothetical protein